MTFRMHAASHSLPWSSDLYLELDEMLDHNEPQAAGEELVHCLCELGVGQGPVKVHSFMDQDLHKFVQHFRFPIFVQNLLKCILHACNPNGTRLEPARLHMCSIVQGGESVSAAPAIIAREILLWLQFKVNLGFQLHVFSTSRVFYSSRQFCHVNRLSHDVIM